MIHSLAWQVTVPLVLAFFAVFAWVALGAGDKADATAISQTSGRIRSWIFWVLVAVFLPIFGYTLRDLPYSVAAVAGGPPQVIKAIGHQWRWELSGTEVQVGKPVDFHITASDVNHGFGLYDPDLKLIAQAQAMPGYTNVLRHVFTRPGKYRVLCLEYCGLVHHGMLAEITASEAK
ncbi:MAG: cytochrome c oxidase subunit II [Burkholderiales bacterium]|nr:cytochrome c oxidase subunit II [Burkholderiales bacterium]